MSKTLHVQFEEKTCPEPNSGCLLWTAATTKKGYGVLRVAGVLKYAHHVAWYLAFGRWPKQLNHHCDTPSCCETSDLYEGNHVQNSRDCIARGRFKNNMTEAIMRQGQPRGAAAQRAKTHCPLGHPYEGDNLYVAASGARKCRACQKRWNTTRS
jgi:HNH endonuclease